jgi:hypothetical protein
MKVEKDQLFEQTEQQLSPRLARPQDFEVINQDVDSGFGQRNPKLLKRRKKGPTPEFNKVPKGSWHLDGKE